MIGFLVLFPGIAPPPVSGAPPVAAGIRCISGNVHTIIEGAGFPDGAGERSFPLNVIKSSFFTILSRFSGSFPETPAGKKRVSANCGKMRIDRQYEIELYKYRMEHLIIWGTISPMT
jgi:hypothetical protein